MPWACSARCRSRRPSPDLSASSPAVARPSAPVMDIGLLARLLREPASRARLTPAEWDVLLRQARHASLLARLEALARDTGVLEAAQARASTTLEAARLGVGHT